MIKKVSENLSTILVFFALVGGFVGANNYLAKASDLRATDQRLAYKIVGDQILDIEKRIFIIETRHNINVPGQTPIPMAPDVLETYHKLRKDLERLIREQEAVLKGS